MLPPLVVISKVETVSVSASNTNVPEMVPSSSNLASRNSQVKGVAFAVAAERKRMITALCKPIAFFTKCLIERLLSAGEGQEEKVFDENSESNERSAFHQPRLRS
jgi:hypothetical protein